MNYFNDCMSCVWRSCCSGCSSSKVVPKSQTPPRALGMMESSKQASSSSISEALHSRSVADINGEGLSHTEGLPLRDESGSFVNPVACLLHKATSDVWKELGSSHEEILAIEPTVFCVSAEGRKYEFVREFGRGSNKLVSLVRVVGDIANRTFCVFVEPLSHPAGKESIARLEHEYKLLLRYRGRKGIAQLHGELPKAKTNENESPGFLMMPYLTNLREKLTDFEFMQDELLRLSAMLQLVSGLESLHGDGLSHGDLKPANCFANWNTVTRDYEFVLGDLEHATREVNPADYFGTPGYWAPEFCRGEASAKKPAFKWDIWALGIIFHQLWLGSSPPWISKEKSSLKESLDRIGLVDSRESQVQSGYLKPDDEESVEFLLWRMLDPDPSMRPSALQIRRDLSLLKDRASLNRTNSHYLTQRASLAAIRGTQGTQGTQSTIDMSDAD